MMCVLGSVVSISNVISLENFADVNLPEKLHMSLRSSSDAMDPSRKFVAFTRISHVIWSVWSVGIFAKFYGNDELWSEWISSISSALQPKKGVRPNDEPDTSSWYTVVRAVQPVNIFPSDVAFIVAILIYSRWVHPSNWLELSVTRGLCIVAVCRLVRFV